MPIRVVTLRHAMLAASALALTIGAGAPALAFSKIDPGGGVSDSREGIIAVPLPPLPSANPPAAPPAARTPPNASPANTTPKNGTNSNGATPAATAQDPGSGDSADPEGTDSEEVPISPEDEDILRQRRGPGRGTTVEDSAPLRPGGNSETRQPGRLQGDQAPGSPKSEPSGSSAAGQATSGGNPTAGADRNPGAVKPFTATGSGAGSGSGTTTSGEAIEPTNGVPTGEADRGDAVAPAVPLPSQIAFGDDGLPSPVRDLRAKLMEIAKTGDIEKLRPYLQGGEDATILSFGDAPKDPIAFLKEASGDGQGVEMLAILLEVLQAGHAHVEPGDADEIYIWPYFTQVQIDTLTKPQMVQLFELVTAGDYDAMKAFGAYNFFRVGISPDGKLEFFVAGD